MAPSSKSTTREYPPPRRKSCAACVKAKRRCDSGQPACVRCSQRQIVCVYPVRILGAEQNEQRQSADSSPGGVPGLVVPAAEPPAADNPVLEAFLGGLGPFSENGLSLLDLGSSFASLGPGMSINSIGLADLDVDDAVRADPASSCSLAPSGRPELLGPAYRLIPPMDPTIVDLFGSRDQASIAHAIASRLQYIMDVLRDTLRQMAVKSQTPWCHRQLYSNDMPQSIRDAHASCALYLAKTTDNADCVFRIVDAYLDDLLSSPTLDRPLDILSRVHALLLYQCIFVFDGDIRLRRNADRTAAALHLALSLLFGVLASDTAANELDSDTVLLPLWPISRVRLLWEAWVFSQSARRSFVIAFAFNQLYRFLTASQPMYCAERLEFHHSLTMSKHLWGAHDALQFATAWRERRHFTVRDACFVDVVKHAQAADLDEFGRMIFTVLLGVDDAKAWFATRGGNL